MPRAKKSPAADAKPAKTTPAKKVKPEPVVEAAPVVETPETESSAVESLQTEFTGFMSKLQQVSTLMAELKQSFRALEKKAGRELRAAEKASQKRKRKAGNRSPSGFVKPTLISNELAAFLGKTQGTEMARTEVTREINAYIRAHNLQDKDNGRKINADKKLAGLLKLKAGEELTYFNLQKYMSPHFAKATKAADTQ
jgi:chromatin remodeling complex protein RSC6